MLLFVQCLLIYNAIQRGTCLLSAPFDVHWGLVRHLFIHLLHEMLYLMESCNSPFFKARSEGTHFSLSAAYPLIYTYIYFHYSLQAFPITKASLSGCQKKIRVLTLPTLKAALTPSLLTQTRTDSPVSSWFLFPIFLDKARESIWGSEYI